MADPLDIRARSADPAPPGLRSVPHVAKLVDTTTCIGCKACEAACVEWNDLGLEPAEPTGTYQTMPDLTATYWNLIRFSEVEREDGRFAWLMRKDQCMHCETAGCLEACPAPGAIVQRENGIVDIDQDRCIGCGYCIPACPFDVPRLSERTGRAHKCTLCVDRVEVGLPPACVKACPTACLEFGSYDDLHARASARVEQLVASGRERAGLYGDALPGVGGRTHVLYVLDRADRPEDYGLPADPRIPAALSLGRRVLSPAGWLAVGLSLLGVAAHFLGIGPDREEAEP